MDQVLSAAVAAGVSVMVVLLTRRSETIKHFQSLRTAAYADFIRGVAGLAILQKEPIQSKEEFLKEREMQILVADAKARIAIYGNASVVSSLANFLRRGSALDSPERARDFTDICQRMRNDKSAKSGEVTNPDIHFLLFNLDPKDYVGDQPSPH